MLISFTGAQSTGKTTLLNACCNNKRFRKFHCIPEVTRKVAREQHVDINEAGDVFIDSISDVISIDGNTTITGSLTVSEDTTLQKKLAVTDTITGSSTVAGTNLDTGHKKGTAYPHG